MERCEDFAYVVDVDVGRGWEWVVFVVVIVPVGIVVSGGKKVDYF